MGGDENSDRRTYEANQERADEGSEECSKGFREYIELLYDEGIKLGYLYKDMYEMDILELENTITERRKGLAYEIWRLASFTRHPFVKEFPETPQEACPELFPRKKGIQMTNWMIKKYYGKENKS